MVESAPNPGCVILTPHDEHPIGRTAGYPAVSIMCPGVRSLAEPTVQQPLSHDDVDAVAAAIRAAVPDDDACVADEEECFRLHPIHLMSSVNGVVQAVYADVEATARLVVDALDLPARDARLRAECDEATQELAAELADERTLHQETIRERDELRAEVARVRADVAEEIAEAIETHHAADDLTAIQSARIARRHASAPAERVQDAPTDTAGTPDPQRYWWHHDGPGPTDNSGLVCGPTPGTADKPRSSGCVGCGCMTTARWRRGEPIPEHPRASVVIQGNACCGGDGDEASCEECR